MLKKVIFILMPMFIFPCCKQTLERDWQLVYRNDDQGNSLHGSKEKLLEAVRHGKEIRIGFGGRRATDTLRSVEHLVDAHFLTIANGREVFAQIQPIIGQRPNLTSDTLDITFREQWQWSIIVGTNGFSDRLMIDRFADTIVSHRNRPMGVSWFVKGQISEDTGLPLW